MAGQTAGAEWPRTVGDVRRCQGLIAESDCDSNCRRGRLGIGDTRHAVVATVDPRVLIAGLLAQVPRWDASARQLCPRSEARLQVHSICVPAASGTCLYRINNLGGYTWRRGGWKPWFLGSHTFWLSTCFPVLLDSSPLRPPVIPKNSKVFARRDLSSWKGGFAGVRAQPPGFSPDPTFSLANSPVSPVDRMRLLTASSNVGGHLALSNSGVLADSFKNERRPPDSSMLNDINEFTSW